MNKQLINSEFDIPNRLVNVENPMLMSFDLKLSCVIKNAVVWSRLVNLISKYSCINMVLYLSFNTIPPKLTADPRDASGDHLDRFVYQYFTLNLIFFMY